MTLMSLGNLINSLNLETFRKPAYYFLLCCNPQHNSGGVAGLQNNYFWLNISSQVLRVAIIQVSAKRCVVGVVHVSRSLQFYACKPSLVL